MRLLKYFTFILFISLELFSQKDINSTFFTDYSQPLYKIGLYGGYNLNMHSADFKELPGFPNCCSGFNSGSGGGFNFGALYEQKINEKLDFTIRLGVSNLDAQLVLSKEIGKTLVKNANNSTGVIPEVVKVDYIIDSYLQYFNLNPMAQYHLTSKLNALGGLKIGYLSGNFDQKEVLTQPNNVVFLENGKLVRNDLLVVKIPDLNKIQLFLNIGLGYDLTLSKGLSVQPELMYNMALLNVSSVSWKANHLSMNAAIKLNIYPPKIIKYIRDTVSIRDTTIIEVAGLKETSIKLIDKKITKSAEEFPDVVMEKYVIKEKYEKLQAKILNISTSLEYYAINNDGTKQNIPTLIIEETEVAESFPLLPYIFYGQGISDISEVKLNLLTTEQTKDFNLSTLKWNTLDIYSEMLNIIAYRMNQNITSKITVTGCNSNFGLEASNTNLSLARAEEIKKYFTDVWKIESDRISIKKQNLPSNAGRSEDIRLQEEYQRAEITSNSIEIIRPIELKEISRSSNPPLVTIEPNVKSDAGEYKWQLALSQDGKEIRSLSGANSTSNLDWKVLDEPTPKLETPLSIDLSATDKYGNQNSTQKSILIKQLTIKKKREVLKDDKKIEKYALIVFDVDKAELTDLHRTILKEVKSKIAPNSNVTIAGYTDITGTTEYNQNLASRRTIEVQKFLGTNNATLQAIGSTELLYDNSTPQGRSYCRTVKITVETPIK
jgi:outer membrane protein OmpA-like peptidoglycan-associated protein